MPSVPKPRVKHKKAWARFARAYGSIERAAWVRSLPCAACGIVGGCDNAHSVNGGAGRKADYRFILPLCHTCHNELHQHGQATFQAKYHLNLLDCAAATEARWTSPYRDP